MKNLTTFDTPLIVFSVIATVFVGIFIFQPVSRECRSAIILQSELTEAASVMYFQYDDQEIVRSETSAYERYFQYRVGDRVELCNYVGKVIKIKYHPYINEEDKEN